MTPGEKINRLMSERRFTVAALADRAGMSKEHLSAMRRGERKIGPSVTIAIGIADALGVDVRWLWTDADWPPVDAVKR